MSPARSLALRWLAGAVLALLTACPAAPGGSADGDADLGAGDLRPVADLAPAWRVPTCAAVAGPPFFTLSADRGVTLLPSRDQLPASAFSFGLVATDRVDTLVGASGQGLYISRDAGCIYQELAQVPELRDIVRLTAAPGGVVYAYSLADSSAVRVTVDGQRQVLRLPVPQIRSLAVARGSAEELAVSDGQTGQIYRSSDGGQRWTASGSPPPGAGLLYFVSFDPAALDHAVVGTAAPTQGPNRAGLQVTRDGGRTWVQGTPLGDAQGHAINLFYGLVHDTDGERVWLLGIDLAEAGNRARHLYLSRDGGLRFQPVVSGADPGVTLTNGTPLFSPPGTPDQLYFTFSDTLQQGTTTLWRYQASDGAIEAHTHLYAQTGELRALAFHPQRPEILYAARTFQRIR